MEEELFYQIALTLSEGIGDKIARELIARLGSAKAIFETPSKELGTITGVGDFRVNGLKKGIDKKRVYAELEFMEKYGIQPLCITDKDYPKLLKECPDAPFLLYYKGKGSLNQKKIIAIVGTRKNTDYGRQMVEELLQGFKGQEDTLILSGLAYGVDSIAHSEAVKQNIMTVGVLGHGLDRIYPIQNRKLAETMTHNGGLLTEFRSGTIPDKQNFPQRNRIVAGMAHVTVVIETAEKGGSMITAKLACSYNREVAAYPGRVIDSRSEGCNYLIRTNIARMITSPDDLKEFMNWQPEDDEKKAVQLKLFSTLNPKEQKVVDLLTEENEVHIDELTLKTSINDSQMASILLSLELEGLVRSLPGKRYRLA